MKLNLDSLSTFGVDPTAIYHQIVASTDKIPLRTNPQWRYFLYSLNMCKLPISKLIAHLTMNGYNAIPVEPVLGQPKSILFQHSENALIEVIVTYNNTIERASLHTTHTIPGLVCVTSKLFILSDDDGVSVIGVRE